MCFLHLRTPFLQQSVTTTSTAIHSPPEGFIPTEADAAASWSLGCCCCFLSLSRHAWFPETSNLWPSGTAKPRSLRRLIGKSGETLVGPTGSKSQLKDSRSGTRGAVVEHDLCGRGTAHWPFPVLFATLAAPLWSRNPQPLCVSAAFVCLSPLSRLPSTLGRDRRFLHFRFGVTIVSRPTHSRFDIHLHQTKLPARICINIPIKCSA